MSELQQLQQLYILADETRIHYFMAPNDTLGSDTKARREETIKNNLKELTDKIQHMIDTGLKL